MEIRYLKTSRRSAFISFCTALVIYASNPLAHDYTETWAGGCCSQDYSSCVARPDHPRPECQSGHEAGDLHSSWSPSCWNTGCIGDPGGCQPEIPTGSVAELPNGIDDDCDYFVDDEQCDEVDNDGDGSVDEDPGSCLLKIAFVPLAWQGTQAEFEAAARAQWNTFSQSLGLSDCADNFAHRYLSVASENLPVPVCTTGCGLGQVTNNFNTLNPNANFLTSNYDLIAAITDQDICNNIAGCSNGADFIWLETTYAVVMAHEVGHIFNLEDEYCSNQAGSTDERCNDGGVPADYDGNGVIPSPDINFMGNDLNCDPRSGFGCCNDCTSVNYGICCEGNETTFGTGRAIMSYANAPEPRRFDQRSFNHLRSPPNPRSQASPTGDAPMDCAFAHLGSTPVVRISYSLNEEGDLSVIQAATGIGRLGLASPRTRGRYGILVQDRSGATIHESAEDIYFDYYGPVYTGIDYSGFQFERVHRALRAPIPSGISPPYIITAMKDGEITSRSCVDTGNSNQTGFTNLVPDSSPPDIICPQDIAVECATPGGVASTDPQLASFFGSAHASDSCDPSPEISNNAPDLFSLGDTLVTFTAHDGDGNESSCTSQVSVLDTIAPVIQCPSATAVECTATGGTSSNNPNVQAFLTGAVASDICDPNPALGSNAPAFLDLGRPAVEFHATDASGNTSTCTENISITDTTPPSLDFQITPNVLSPPNHKLVTVEASLTVNDICDANPGFILHSITSNQPVNDSGDGNTAPDIYGADTGTSDVVFQLRAERSGQGADRIYRIEYTATDMTGNSTSSEKIVHVGHDNR